MRCRFVPLVIILIVSGALHPAAAQLWGDASDRAVALSPPVVATAGKQASVVFPAQADGTVYNGVVLQGYASAPVLEGWVRFGSEAEEQAWQPLYLVRSASDGSFLAAFRGDTFRSDTRFELRFTVEAGAEVTLFGAGVFDNRADADRVPVRQLVFPPGKSFHDDYVIVPLALIPRSAWGAEPFRGDPIPLNRPTYDYITFHHAAGFGATTLEEGLQQVKNIQDFHQNGRGWSDIGYQFVMDQSGRLYQGRPFLNNSVSFADGPPLVQGAHVGNFNTGNIGVCALGCYHPPEGPSCRDVMTPAALDSLVTMFAYLSERYGVSPDNIRGHRDFGSTACPGDNNYELLPTIRSRVAELLREGNLPLGTASLVADVDEAGVVRLSWTFLEDAGIAGYTIERVDDDANVVIYEGDGALPDVVTDPDLRRPGPVTYLLRARGGTGRTQTLASAEVLLEAPAGEVLAQNFPNPFQSTTTIRYYVASEGFVSLAVYDALGREVARLSDGFQDGDRWQSAIFDARDLPSGTYYYRLQVEGFSGIIFDKTAPITHLK